MLLSSCDGQVGDPSSGGEDTGTHDIEPTDGDSADQDTSHPDDVLSTDDMFVADDARADTVLDQDTTIEPDAPVECNASDAWVAQICVDHACVSSCGDGTRQDYEACEGANLGGGTCQTLGFAGGTTACSTSSELDTAGCRRCAAFTSASRLALGDTWQVTGPPGGNITAALALGGGHVLAGTGLVKGMSGASPIGYGSAIYRSEDEGHTYELSQRFAHSTVQQVVRVGTTDRIYAAVGSLSGALTDSDTDGV